MWIQETNLDNFPNKPRNWLQFHLSDVLIQCFHKNFVVWLWKNNSRKQIWYNSLVGRIQEKVERMNSQLYDLHVILRWDLQTAEIFGKFQTSFFLHRNSSTVTKSNAICPTWLPSPLILNVSKYLMSLCCLVVIALGKNKTVMISVSREHTTWYRRQALKPLSKETHSIW